MTLGAMPSPPASDVFRTRLLRVGRSDGQRAEEIARWLREREGEPGAEQILPPSEQRELDALPSGLDRTEHI